jgi:pyrroloquinoline-quinone synthase
VNSGVKCAACGIKLETGDYDSLASHFYNLAEQNDVHHVMWLNRNITKERTDASDLSKLLKRYLGLDGTGLDRWMKVRFVQRFYGANPHPFVVAMQRPTRATLLGYVLEHQHFLRQWVRSCAYIIAKTDKDDVVLYELDNVNTEFGGFGPGRPSHYELLIRMGESLGFDRQKILNTPPLPETRKALNVWDEIAKECHWVETMAAMHGLELIADRNLRKEVKEATMSYFDPVILQKESKQITEAAKDFLREGYEADVEHTENALKLASKYSQDLGLVEDVQATFLKSIDTFSGYLMARLERAEQIAN